MEAKNNHILIDIGRHGSYFVEHGISGKTFTFDTTYGGGEYIRRSGIVLAVPKEFVYHIPFNMEHRLNKIQVEVGDMVFFDWKAFQYCETNNLIDKTIEGNTVYLMPYRYLVCAIKKNDNERVQMLNGRVLVKMRHDLSKSNTIIQYADPERTQEVFRYAEITHVDNNEGYEGISYDRNTYNLMTYSKQELKVGDIVVLNKYADFDLQSIFKETTEHNELEKSFVVHRSEIVCFKHNESDSFKPYGLYCKIDPIKRDDKINEHLSYSKRKPLRTAKGIVLEMGCGIYNTHIGAEVRIKEKVEVIIEKEMYVHNLWILLR